MFQNNSNPKKISYPDNLTFQEWIFLDNPLNDFTKFTLTFKNFSNNLIIKHSHFHALLFNFKKNYIFIHI